MDKNIAFNQFNNTDLNMYQCGMENCNSGHYYGPAVRDHYLIHYICRGRGIFRVGNTTYNLEKNQGFLICPNIVAYYQADYDDPWSYSWVGFHGLKAESYLKLSGISCETPIFTYDKDEFIRDCFKKMLDLKGYNKANEIRLLSYLYMFLSRLIESNNGQKNNMNSSMDKKEMYIKKAVEYIERNYTRRISVSAMANYLNLDRSYIGSIFKHYLNTSPQKYIINFRINKACELMNNNELSIGDIARSVGYEDPLQFSKIFRMVKGECPREYRKRV